MGNAVNWIEGGSWAPKSDAQEQLARKQLDDEEKRLKDQQEQLKSLKASQQTELNAKRAKQLRLLSATSALSQPVQQSNLLG